MKTIIIPSMNENRYEYMQLDLGTARNKYCIIDNETPVY